MKKTKLINAIKETIIDLETGRKEYSFISAATCNCGLLAQNITGFSVEELREKDVLGGWGRIINIKCQWTDTPLDGVFGKLYAAGLTDNDLENLEHLSDEKILKETNIKPFTYSTKESVLKYFKAWLRILEREEQKEQNYNLKVSATFPPEITTIPSKELKLS